jgi:xanthine/uracil permease
MTFFGSFASTLIVTLMKDSEVWKDYHILIGIIVGLLLVAVIGAVIYTIKYTR